MKFIVDIASDGVIFTLNFIKIGSGIQTLLGGIHTQKAMCSRKPTFTFKK
jgi:hypothetical protein